MAKALLVIDVQSKYMDKYDPSLLDSINERIGKSSDNGAIIVYTSFVSNQLEGFIFTAYDLLFALDRIEMSDRT